MARIRRRSGRAAGAAAQPGDANPPPVHRPVDPTPSGDHGGEPIGEGTGVGESWWRSTHPRWTDSPAIRRCRHRCYCACLGSRGTATVRPATPSSGATTPPGVDSLNSPPVHESRCVSAGFRAVMLGAGAARLVSRARSGNGARHHGPPPSWPEANPSAFARPCPLLRRPDRPAPGGTSCTAKTASPLPAGAFRRGQGEVRGGLPTMCGRRCCWGCCRGMRVPPPGTAARHAAR